MRAAAEGAGTPRPAEPPWPGARAALADPVPWHDLECGSYAADLPLWIELAERARGPVLELGCGAGRVALHLARGGYPVTGVDSDPALVRELAARAAAEGLPVDARVGDARELGLERHFALLLAPMQLLHLLPTPTEREALVRAAAAHLRPGGIAAFALLAVSGSDLVSEGAALPDIRERQGWVLSSHPAAVRSRTGALEVERRRQAVTPTGEIAEQVLVEHLAEVDPAEIEEWGRAAGLAHAGRRAVPATSAHVGSTILQFQAPIDVSPGGRGAP